MKHKLNYKAAIFFLVMIIALLMFSVYFSDHISRLTGFAVVNEEENYGVPEVIEMAPIEEVLETGSAESDVVVEVPVEEIIVEEEVVEDLIEEPTNPGKEEEEETYGQQADSGDEESYGVQEIVNCGYTIKNPGSYEVDQDLICIGGHAHGIRINSSNVILDCHGHTMQDTAAISRGIYVEGDGDFIFSNITIQNCKVESFDYGFYLEKVNGLYLLDSISHLNKYTTLVDIDGGITRNYTSAEDYGRTAGVHCSLALSNVENYDFTESNFSSPSVTVDIWSTGSISNVTVWENLLHRGIYDDSPVTCCSNGIGNFYNNSIFASYVCSTECGIFNFSISVDENDYSDSSDKTYNLSQVVINWTNQTAPLDLSLVYNLNISNQTTTFYSANVNPNSVYNWDSSSVLKGNINLTFSVSSGIYNAYLNPRSRFVRINNDNDSDGYSVAVDDCNDNSASANPGQTEAMGTGTTCYDMIDNDCSTGKDWNDDDCGGSSFNDGGFRIFTNGSITNISNVSNLVLDNQYGSITFEGSFNLQNKDFSNAVIGLNSIYLNPSQLSLFAGRSATIRFNLSAFGYAVTPQLYKDGVGIDCGVLGTQCSNGYYNPVTKQYTVTVAGFSNYTTGNSSQLLIYDQSDAEGGSRTAEAKNMIWFYANYSRSLDGSPIDDRTSGNDPVLGEWDNGTCVLYFPGLATTNMTFNNITYLYEKRIYTETTGVLEWNVSCTSNNYEKLNGTDSINVFTDTTPPVHPIIYASAFPPGTSETGENPFYTGNATSSQITIAGYGNESNLTINITVLLGTYSFSYEFTGESGSSESLLQQSATIQQFNATTGQKIFFVDDNAANSAAFKNGNYVEFSGHDRTYFRRYAIDQAVEVGSWLRVNMTEGLEDNVTVGETVRVYDTALPSGYFIKNITLQGGGNNLVIVEATDLSGNENSTTKTVFYTQGDRPYFDLSTIPDYANTTTPTLSYKVYADNGINESTLTVSKCYENTIAHWRLDGNAKDYAGENDGTIVGDANYTTGQVNRSFLFNGSNYIETTDIFYSNTLSIEAWVNFAYNCTAGKICSIVNKRGSGNELSFAISSGKVVFQAWNESNSPVFSFYSTDLSNDVWHHVAATFDGSMAKIYVNGILNSSTASVTGAIQNTTSIYRIGADGSALGTRKFNGSIDEVTIYNRSLSAAEILDHYNHGVAGRRICGDTDSDHSCSGNDCQSTLRLQPGRYDLGFYVEDDEGYSANATKDNFVISVSTPQIDEVDDHGDITYNTWLNFNWTVSGNESDIQYYQYALGTSAGATDVIGWQNTTNKYVNLTSSNFTITANNVYYLTVRLVDYLGNTSSETSSNGILFVDATPPVKTSLTVANYSNSLTSLSASWTFEDNESDIIMYEYSIGTASHPNQGFEDAYPRTPTSETSMTRPNLTLTEGEQYFWNVRARNGNLISGYNGTWSQYYTSSPILVDTIAPTNLSISYEAINTTANYTDIYYSTGLDNQTGADEVSGVSYGIIEMAIKQIDLSPYPTCPSVYTNYEVINRTVVATGMQNQTITVNLSHGYCHFFRLTVFDHAGNSRTQELVPTVLVMHDATPPTTPTNLHDDGFYTNDKNSLHASWTASTDDESGIQTYHYRILKQGDTTNSSQNCAAYPQNCDEEATGTTSGTSITVYGLNLTHQKKYYFQVWAENYLGAVSGNASTDGILYLDNAAPAPAIVTQVNDDNTSARWFVTTQGNGSGVNITINFTAEYPGTCRLLKQDLDYTPTAPECTSLGAGYYSCFNNTAGNRMDNGLTTTDGQGNFTWYISCEDTNGNGQTYLQNTHVSFTVDYPEAATVNVNITPVNATVSDTLNCTATISDPDEGEAYTQANVTWYIDNIIEESTIASVTNNIATDTLSSGYIRGNNVSCNVTVKDQFSLNGSGINSIEIRNTPPPSVSLTAPANGAKIKSVFGFSQDADDADGDYLTYEIKFMNSTANESTLAYGGTVTLSRAGTQAYPSLYENIAAYQDNRTGNEDIYTYNIDTGVETLIVSGSKNQTRPKIYGDYIAYQQLESGPRQDLYVINRNSAAKELISASVTENVYDIWQDSVAYATASGVYLYSISSDSATKVSSDTATNISIYGDTIAWQKASSVVVYDIVANETDIPAPGDAVVPKIFGQNLVFSNSTGTYYLNLQTQASSQLAESSSAYAIYGDQIFLGSASNRGKVYDISNNVNSTIYNLASLSQVAIYKNRIAYELSADIVFKNRTFKIPSNTYLERDGDAHSFTFSTINSKDGQYSWTVIACDSSYEANACNQSETRTFTLDNTPPVINITSPSNGGTYSNTVSLSARVTDSIDISRVNYSVYYTNMTVFNSNNNVQMPGSSPYSATINFTALGEDGSGNFTVVVQATDELNNTNTSSVNISVDNRLPYFDFVSFENSTKVVNDTITDNFTAYNVKTSTLTIYDSSNNIKFRQSQTDATETDHTYEDDISVSAWNEGTYIVSFEASNTRGTHAENRTFSLDLKAPQYIADSHAGDSKYANETKRLVINWSDQSLADVNISYYNLTNRTPENGTWITVDSPDVSGASYYVEITDLRIYINKTFVWNSTAVDGLGRRNTTNFSFSVLNNPVLLTGYNGSLSFAENSGSATLDLDTVFVDANDGHEGFDNLTFASLGSADLNITIDQGTGMMTITALSDTPQANYSIRVNATDLYGSYNETNITVFVTAENDAPILSVTMPNVTIAEDSYNDTINLSNYFTDPDGDNLTFTHGSATNLNITINRSMVNISPDANFNGNRTLQFIATDTSAAQEYTTVYIFVTAVNDAPTAPNITIPSVGELRTGNVTIEWTQSTDIDADSINYSTYYTIDGGATWNYINSVADVGITLWQSANDIPNSVENVTIRINASDGAAVATDTMDGNFTLDNDAPDVFLHMPNETIIVGTSVFINVTTDENAWCTFTLDNVNVESTTNTTQHSSTETLSSTGSHTLNISCADAFGVADKNTGYNSTTFDSQLVNISLNSVSVSPSITYQNQTVNISLNITSKYNVSTMLVNVSVPGFGQVNLTRDNFTPSLEGGNVNNITLHVFNQTDDVGKYNLTVFIQDDQGNSDSNMSLLEVFEIFQQITQQVNMD